MDCCNVTYDAILTKPSQKWKTLFFYKNRIKPKKLNTNTAKVNI